MKTAVIYARVSTSKQANEGISLSAQLDQCRQWVQAHDHELRPDLGEQGCFVDRGKSGKDLQHRHAAQAAIAAACKLKATLLFYSFSRIARSMADAVQIADRLHKAGANFVSLSEGLDTTTAMGEFVYFVISAFNHMVRRVTSENTRSVLAYVKANGKRAGGIPYGMMLDPAAPETDRKTKETVYRRLMPCPVEQEIIACIRAWRDHDHYTFDQIVHLLAAEGVRTRKGHPFTKSNVYGLYRGQRYHKATL